MSSSDSKTRNIIDQHRGNVRRQSSTYVCKLWRKVSLFVDNKDLRQHNVKIAQGHHILKQSSI